MRPQPLSPGGASANRATDALVLGGLARFGHERLAAPDPVFAQLAAGVDPALFPALTGGDWDAGCRRLAALAPELAGALGALLKDYRLELHEWFLLGLAGSAEARYPVNLALAELQAPERSPRPSVHLAAARCAARFAVEVSAPELARGALVRSGVLRLEGDGPLPLRALAMAPELWALLRGDGSPWPRCRFLQPEDAALLPEAVHAEIRRLVAVVRGGGARVLALRAGRPSAALAAAHLARALGRAALEVPLDTWRDRPELAAACRYGGWLPVLAPALGPGEQLELPRRAGFPGPVAVLLGREGAVQADGLVELDLPPLPLAQRRRAWRNALADAPDDGLADTLAETALVDGAAIPLLAERARLDAARLGAPPAAEHVARARAQLGAERLRLLAQPVPQRPPPEALVLPAELQQRFDDLVRRCRHRESLWEGLGVTLQTSASPGVRALFVGESGTGKTLAALRLATELAAPLYRVDLAAVMNKYVGESEKNLGLLLDEAAASDVVLLLDEADALFGRRSDGGETGERYANMLTNFLLGRIEAHSGIVVLTSNSRSRIDAAFTRRLDAILEFPLPGAAERLRLWQCHLGDRGPGEPTCRLLAAYCELPGGHIRNVVVNAAARSRAAAGEPLPVADLVAALREEFRKLGRTLPAALEQLGTAP